MHATPGDPSLDRNVPALLHARTSVHLTSSPALCYRATVSAPGGGVRAAVSGRPRRNERARQRRTRRFPLSPLVRAQAAWRAPWNCSSSVDPLSAVVDDSPFWIACVTASK